MEVKRILKLANIFVTLFRMGKAIFRSKGREVGHNTSLLPVSAVNIANYCFKKFPVPLKYLSICREKIHIV